MLIKMVAHGYVLKDMKMNSLFILEQLRRLNRVVLPEQMTEELMRTLKVSWDVRDGAYTCADLREVFGHHGRVEDVIIRQVLSVVY